MVQSLQVFPKLAMLHENICGALQAKEIGFSHSVKVSECFSILYASKEISSIHDPRTYPWALAPGRDRYPVSLFACMVIHKQKTYCQNLKLRTVKPISHLFKKIEKGPLFHRFIVAYQSAFQGILIYR